MFLFGYVEKLLYRVDVGIVGMLEFYDLVEDF